MPVTTAYAAPAATVATTSGRFGTRSSLHKNATAAHASARCEPDTATRCVSPSTLKSSSASVPVSRRRSPSTMPSARSPPGPSTECIRASASWRHAKSGPVGPGRHPPTSARQALPVAQTPDLAVRRAHGSLHGNGFRIAANRTVRPTSGANVSAGHPTRTRAPSRGPPSILTRTTTPNAPGSGSASTVPAHSRAPHAPAVRTCRCHAAPCSPESKTPAIRPPHSSAATGRRAARLQPTAAAIAVPDPAGSSARRAIATPNPSAIRQLTASPMTQPAAIARANHTTGGRSGRAGGPFTRRSRSPSVPRTSSRRYRRPA